MPQIPTDPNDLTGGMLPGIPEDIETLRGSMGGAQVRALLEPPPPGGQAPGGMPGAPPLRGRARWATGLAAPCARG